MKRITSVSATSATLIVLALFAVLATTAGCRNEDSQAQARRISTRSDLIGGPGALGEVGDFILENEKIRVVVQDKGFSRGFGVYGGSLIDADLRRATPQGGQAGGHGMDTFGELFPIFFLEALVPDKVEVVNDGSDGKAAVVMVSGDGGEFLTLTKVLDQILLNSHEVDLAKVFSNPDPEVFNGAPKLGFRIIYELEPGARYVTIKNRLVNLTDEDLPIPSAEGLSLIGALLGGQTDIDVPIGNVLLFGAGNKVFAPGIGYNLRFGIEDSYGVSLPFPALPGALSDIMVSTNDKGVSYGFMTKGDTPNFAQHRVDAETGENVYEQVYDVDVTDRSLLIPFLASAFTGVFYGQAPRVLAAAGTQGDTFETTSYFIVGDGDVSSVMDTAYKLRTESTSPFSGIVRDETTLAAVDHASVVVYDEVLDKPVNQFFTDKTGQFLGELPPGQYRAVVHKDPVVSKPTPFSITAGSGRYLELTRPGTGRIYVNVRDTEGREIPAKVTVVGTAPSDAAGKRPRGNLFDLEVGQRWRYTDFVPDVISDPSTLQYIENTAYTEEGEATIVVPGDRSYTVYVSRGPEYDLQGARVFVASGAGEVVTTTLTRVIDTPGYIAGDFHVHAAPSLDSDLPLHERVVSCAGEGLELAVATDHNFITDYRPMIEKLNLQEWLASMVGIELTTLEGGHYNGFPLRYEPGEITRGSFEWSSRPPQDIFDELRNRGQFGRNNTIVQINHPRDSILGYFSQHALDPLSGEIIPVGDGGFGDLMTPNGPAFRDADGGPTYSGDFDAVEVLNGKRFDLTWHLRMPEDISGLEIPDATRPLLPSPGTILCNGDGDVAFAGAIDDWFNMLNRGDRYVATANSDSHQTTGGEPGTPRTYVYVGDHDSPMTLESMDIVNGFHSHRVVLTNGPFVDLSVQGQPIGSDVEASAGSVDVEVTIKAPHWINVTRGSIYGNGRVIDTFDVNMTGTTFKYETSLNIPVDTWLLVYIEGDESMFPAVPPAEIPSVAISDAVSSLAEPLGFGSGVLGEIEPPKTNAITPQALTNPIWVDSDGDGFKPPGVLPRACLPGAFGVTEAGPDDPDGMALMRFPKKPASPLVKSLWFPRRRGDLHDVRTVFENFAGHGH